MKNTKEEEELI